MIKILIVDDEPIIANGLYALLEHASEDYEVYKSFSAQEALDLLMKIRMDLVLSDIKMPGISGIEMLEKIKKQWPSCHVIFLSGYSDFNYVQSALQFGADSYLLKSQGDDIILQTVAHSVQMIHDESCSDFWQKRIQEELVNARPLLCHDFLWKLLLGEIYEKDQIETQLLNLGLPLTTDSFFLLVGGRIDRLPDSQNSMEQSTGLLEQIDAVFTEYLSSKINTSGVYWDQRYLIWILQPLQRTEVDAEYLNCFISGMLEKIQSHCLEQMRTEISFVMDPVPCTYENLPCSYAQVRSVLTYHLSPRDEMLLGKIGFFGEGTDFEANLSLNEIPDILMRDLTTSFEYHQKESFCIALKKLLDYLTADSKPAIQIETYHRLSLFFLEQMNKTGRSGEFLNTFHGFEPFSMPFEQWRGKLYQAFIPLEEWLFQGADESHSKRFHQMVSILHQYIDHNLDKDLSINALAEIVYLNPVYLSRAYKQATGGNLSEYVLKRRIDTAKLLLRQPDKKISDTAYLVGFESAAHFSRVFKKITGKTPQEYRNQ